MKARFKKTGEIVEVTSYGADGSFIEYIDDKGTTTHINYYGNDHFNMYYELLWEESIDWEQRRWNLCCDIVKQEYRNQHFEDKASIDCFVNGVVGVVDNLIEKLKK